MTITDRLADTVLEAYRRSFSVKSNYAREHAEVIAMAACLQLITTKVHLNTYSSEWRPTSRGLALLAEQELLEDDDG